MRTGMYDIKHELHPEVWKQYLFASYAPFSWLDEQSVFIQYKTLLLFWNNEQTKLKEDKKISEHANLLGIFLDSYKVPWQNPRKWRNCKKLHSITVLFVRTQEALAGWLAVSVHVTQTNCVHGNSIYI